MKTLTTCGAILVDESGKVLIIRRSASDKHRPHQWDLPGGHVEPGETFEAALVREVREETSLDISSATPTLVYALSDVVEEVCVTWLFFVVPVQNAPVSLSYEHDEYQWLTIDEAIEAVEYVRKQSALIYARDNKLL